MGAVIPLLSFKSRLKTVRLLQGMWRCPPQEQGVFLLRVKLCPSPALYPLLGQCHDGECSESTDRGDDHKSFHSFSEGH